MEAGTIRVFGKDVVSEYRDARKHIGLSPQEFNIDIFETVQNVLDYVAGYYGLRASERRERVDELLERFSLTHKRAVEFRQLSGGLKRRVMLARAMVHDPDLLILDEPTAGVDVELRHELWRYLRELNEAGKTIVLTSHYLEEVELLCSRIAILNRGVIVEEGTKESFVGGGRRLEERYLAVTQSDYAV